MYLEFVSVTRSPYIHSRYKNNVNEILFRDFSQRRFGFLRGYIYDRVKLPSFVSAHASSSKWSITLLRSWSCQHFFSSDFGASQDSWKFSRMLGRICTKGSDYVRAVCCYGHPLENTRSRNCYETVTRPWQRFDIESLPFLSRKVFPYNAYNNGDLPPSIDPSLYSLAATTR